MLGINALEQPNETSTCNESSVASQWLSAGIMMETVQYGKDNFEVPSGLSEDFSYLMDIISPDTWNNVLTDEHRELLMKFLPDFPEDDLNEKTHTLEMFFMNKNFYFGSALQKFVMDFKKGFFNPDIAKIRKIHRKILHRSYKYRQKKYFHNLLEEILVKRQEVFDGVRNKTEDKGQNHQQQHSTNVISKSEACMQRASKRYFKELKSVKVEAGCDSDLSDDDNFSEGIGLSLNKKQRRQLFLLEASFPSHLCLVRSTHTKGSLALDLEAKLTSNKNPFDATEEQFKNLLSIHLSNHKKKNCPSLDTRGLTLKSVLERSEMLARRPVQRLPPSPLNPAPSSRLLSTSSKKPPRKKLKPCPQALPSLPLIAPEEIKRELSSDSLSSEGEVHDLDISKDVDSFSAATTMEDIKPSLTAELTQETHLSFFSLLRDIVCSTPNQRMSRQQVVSSISTWQESAISPLNEWFCLSDSWELILPSAINFLCGNIATDLLPCDFVPFIEQKCAPKHYQWIGAGRDSDANLEPLCQYWLSNRDKLSNEWPKDVTNNSVTEDVKSVVQNTVPQKLWDVKPVTEVGNNARTEYHLQEKSRYEQPHKAFTYRMNGYESVIGPVKGVYTHQQSGSTTKARGHMLLVPDRPPFVTILSLVWDAVARLPNSEGTKMEICELLKASQFLVPINSPTLENALNVVVSGALDRLQNEKDPCVKFDTSRKLWVYLHKFRSEKELEMMHQLKLRSGSTKAKSQTSARKISKKKEDASLNQGPPNVTMEQFTPAIKQMDGSEIRIKDEDILTKWEKLSTTKGKRKEKNIKSSALLKQESSVVKSINLGAVDNASLSSGSQILPVFTSQTTLQTSPSAEDEKSAVSLSNNTPQSSAIQIVKGSSTSVQTTASPSMSPNGSVKPLLQSQTSRKYQSSSERKKLLKANDGGRASPSTTKIVATSKSLSNQPLTSTTTVGAQQPKGIKLLQYSNPNLQAKGLVSNASLVMDASNAVPALVGQKLVVAGSRVLVQGGKVLHNVASAGSRGKQVLAGMLPAQHIVAVNSIKKPSGEQQTVEGSRFIQIATVDAQGGYQKPTGYQKLALLPQFTQATLASGSGKAQEISPLGLGKGSVATTGELKVKLGSAGFATATGNIISLGGKQILLATKGGAGNRSTQIHQVVLGDSRARVDVGGSGGTSQQIIVPASASSQQSTVAPVSVTSQQVTATTSSGATQQQRLTLSGQQIMVPASALAGSQLNLKRLQAFQSFKVVSASQLAQHQGSQRGKPVVAHILAPSPSTSAAGPTSTPKLPQQIATSSENTPEK